MASTNISVSAGDRIRFGPCYAALAAGELVVGNEHIERRWRVENGLLYPASFRDLLAGCEWLTGSPSGPAPLPPVPVPDEAREVHLTGGGGKRAPTEEPSLAAELTAAGATLTLRYHFQIFPAARGVIVQLSTEPADGAPRSWAPSGQISAPDAAPTGIEAEPPPAPGDAPLADTLELLDLAPQHLRLTQVTLRDQTDRHNELVQENGWLLHPAEATLPLQGNLFVAEDVLTRAGLIFLKHAPLPHARPGTSPYDLRVQAKNRQFHLCGHGQGDESGDGYRFVVLAYTGGRWGRIEALQTYQRQVRGYDPGRDAMFLSNTWGDRSKDGRVNEPFLRQEVEAAARLGVDVVQIDDGWQQGKTSNSVEAGGVWEGFWNADPHFWTPHRERFPHGLDPLVQSARAQGMQFGLWFAPDSTDDFAHGEQDADTLLGLHRSLGVRYFKIDGVKLRTRRGERNLRRFYDKVLEGSDGRVVFDNDVTAETRPGYFGVMHTGPLFVENRYTDWHRYWPHQTLRNLWKLAHHVDPLRLRMEFLNNRRNTHLYAGDPLAPSCYRPAYLFATTMFANPLGWFEVSSLPDDYFDEVAPLAGVWKAHRERIFRGRIFPIGEAPDGTAWTGFASVGDGGRGGYVLLFRELNDRAQWAVDLPMFSSGTFASSVLAGQGSLSLSEGRLMAEIPRAQEFLFARVLPPLPSEGAGQGG